jgi:hypothetical protein
MIRQRLRKLEKALAPPPPPRVLAAVAWRGTVSEILVGAVNQPAPEGMTTADLPAGCVVFESNPREETAMLYLRTDGRPGCQRVIGVDLDTIVGRNLIQRPVASLEGGITKLTKLLPPSPAAAGEQR